MGNAATTKPRSSAPGGGQNGRQQMAAQPRPMLVWVPVTGADGRVRMEMRWLADRDVAATIPMVA